MVKIYKKSYRIAMKVARKLQEDGMDQERAEYIAHSVVYGMLDKMLERGQKIQWQK